MLYQKTLDMLTSMGIDAQKSGSAIVFFETEAVTEYVMGFCNIDRIPDELINTCVQMICGRIISKMLSCGMLDSLDFDTALSSLKEGDVTITFDTAHSSRSQFEKLAEGMAKQDSVLIKYRKMCW